MRPAAPHPWLKFFLCVLLCLFWSGCFNSKSFWQKKMANIKNPTIGGELQLKGLRPPVVFAEHNITNAVVGALTNQSIRVAYGPGLQEQAACVARAAEQALLVAEQTIAQPLPLRPHFYLLRLPDEQRFIRFKFPIHEPDRTLPWFLPITNAPALVPDSGLPHPTALWSDLRHLPFHIFVMVHEICEIYLMHPPKLLAMPDVLIQKGFLSYHFRYRTRWFRDGLANFVGLKASEAFRRQLIADGIEPGPMHFTANSMRPLFELSKVRADVFLWAQSSTRDYYPAATALFLLLEERHGSTVVADIVHELPSVEFPNGKALQRLVLEKTGTDLRQLARNFKFPDIGFETTTHPTGQLEIRTISTGGWAEAAHLRQGDLVSTINGAPVISMIDLEFQIFRALQRAEKVNLGFMREGQPISAELF